jgi:hypothetical protein
MNYNTVTNQNAAEVLLWRTCLCHNHIRNSCNNSTTTPWIQPEHHYNPIKTKKTYTQAHYPSYIEEFLLITISLLQLGSFSLPSNSNMHAPIGPPLMPL